MSSELADAEEVLFRQVHPAFYPEGVLGSSAFTPNSQDKGQLSCDRSALFSAEMSFEHYTANLGKASACVFGLSVKEFKEENIICRSDPIAATNQIPPNPAHCLADYNNNAPRHWKIIAKRLKIIALRRGILHKA